MRGSLVIAGALLGAVAFVGAPAQATSAPDPYSGSIETDCRIDVPSVVKPGKRVRVKISVAANSPTPPTGNVTITVTTRPGGDLVWDKTVKYNGGTKTVVGPVLDEDKNYTATSRFRPDDDTFARCRANAEFAVGNAGGGKGPDNDGDDDTGGLLPDTGGPALLWLLLGVGLVGGGSATVVYARRRAASPVTA